MKTFLCFCVGMLFMMESHAQKVTAQNLMANQNKTGFIQNKGQIKDQEGNENPEVKYLLSGIGMNIQLLASGFSYDNWTAVEDTNSQRMTNERNGFILDNKFKEPVALRYSFHRVDVQFIGANPTPEIIPSNESEDYINFYTTGNADVGITNVHHYRIVTYNNIYNGIDLVFVAEGKDGKPEYNFVVHPGADASKIKWQYRGANNTSLRDNIITINTAQGNLEERIPLSFIEETGKVVKVKYNQESENVYSFDIADYQPTKNTLIIDPTPAIQWATYFGGNIIEVAWGVSTDRYDNIYVSGETSSTTGMATSGAYQTIFGGSYRDIFIAKFNANGKIQWATYYGGNGSEIGSRITTDTSGNIYITGATWSTTGIATSGAYRTKYNGGYWDAFLAKFNNKGAIQWGTYFGGNFHDLGYNLVTDASGNVIITGQTTSDSGIATSGAYQKTIAKGKNQRDAFLAKFNKNGTIIWSTYFGGNDMDEGCGITSDSLGHIIITGLTISDSGLATKGAFDTTYNGNGDAFVANFNDSGTLIWATYLGGKNGEESYDVSFDYSGSIFITGYTQSTTTFATTGAYQTSYGGGNYDAFLAKFNNGGTLQWCTYYGGSGDDYGVYLITDLYDNVFITGQTTSYSGISFGRAYQSTLGGIGSSWKSGDVFLTKFSNDGAIQWGTYFGGSKDERGESLCMDMSGNVIFAGGTESNTGIATKGANDTTLTGSWDAFVAKFSGLGCPTPYFTGDTSVCINTNTSYKADSIPGFSYNWTVKGGSIISGNGTISINVHWDSTGTVELILNKGPCSESLVERITVNPLPLTNAGIDDTICLGTYATLGSKAVSSSHYLWTSNPVGFTSISSNPLVSPTISTTYYLTEIDTITGCSNSDSVMVKVNFPNGSTFNATACNSYVFAGKTLTQSGAYFDSLTNVLGCDSVVKLNLTIHNTQFSIINQTSCNSYVFKGKTLTQSGAYYDTLVNQYGCDSIITLKLIINKSNGSSYAASACYSYVFGGKTLTKSGIYVDTFTNASGCDSVVTLNLTINKSTAGNISVSACYSYIFGGKTLTNSGVYLDTLKNHIGCDSILTLNLTINKSNGSTASVLACDSFVFNGKTLTSSGTYYDTFTNAKDCDSILTLNLTIQPKGSIFPKDTSICNGDSITLTASGGTSYLWNTNNTTNQIRVAPNQDAKYSVKISDANCSNTDTAMVHVYSICPKQGEGLRIYIPNAFSPQHEEWNKDTLNQFFFPVGEDVIKYSMTIWSRWGNKIFETDKSEKWDGTLRSRNKFGMRETVPLGVYYYNMTITDHEGKEHRMRGSVNVIR